MQLVYDGVRTSAQQPFAMSAVACIFAVRPACIFAEFVT